MVTCPEARDCVDDRARAPGPRRARLVQGHVPRLRGRRRDRPRARARRPDAARPVPGGRRRRGHAWTRCCPGSGGEVVAADAHDPLGRELRGCFALVEDGGTAIVETATASGLGLVAEDERDAWAASTYGTGELIAAAAAAGAQVIVVAVGGSATTDGGAGALEAIEEAGGLGGARLVVLCDVRTPFEDAPKVFGPQKGADPAMVKRLEERLGELAGALAARPARRADDRLRRRPVRRPVGRARRHARAGRPVGARRARLRRAHARRARGDHRRGQARRADAAGQARRRDRHPRPSGRRAAARDRRHRRARRRSASA